MSYDYNYKFWIATTEELPDLFAKEEAIAKKEADERLEKHDNFAELYAFYVTLYNKLTYLYEKTYQIQKSTVIQKLLESTTNRVLELRNELKNLEFSEFIYVDKILLQRKIVPSEIQILLPTYFPFFRPKEIQEELDIDDDYNIYQDIKNKTPSRLIPIITIQSHERAKRARLLLFLIKTDPKLYLPKPSAATRFKYEFMHKENQAMLIPMKKTRFEGEYYASRVLAADFKYYESPARRKGGLKKEMSGSEDMLIPEMTESYQWPEHYEEEYTQEAQSIFTYFSSSSKESNLFLQDLAARKIQSAWHWYKFRKHLQRIKVQEGEFLGMIFPRKVSRNRYEEMSKFRKYRRRRQEMFEQQFLKACEDEKTRILKLRGPTIMEDISDHIRYWFKEFYQATGDFHPYPDTIKGGTILLLKGNTMTLQEFIQKQNEKGKDKKDGKKGKDDEAEGKKKKSKLGKYALEIKNNVWQYEVDYVHIDEKNNVKEEPYMEWVKEGVLVDIHTELRAIVDELMIIEFELLREALAIDNKTAYKPQKRKKPKKPKKKKKEVDLTEGKSFKDLFDEMLAAGLIRKYKPKTFDDFIGDLSYCAYEVPWKSTLPTSSSYKSGSSSSYSSRENANNTETATSPRFSSISSPAAYRPSYSGGTYRSVPIKKENVSNYPSRYNSTTTTDAKDEKERDKSAEPSLAKSQTTQKKYQGNLSNKENTCNHKPSRLSTSISNLSNKSGQRSRDPSPIQYERRPSISTTSRVRSRDPSPVLNNLRGRISRETSPVQSSRSSLIASRVRSREPSPATSYTTLRGRSRDPSPSSLSGYTPGTYRLASRISTAYTPRYGSNTSLARTAIPDKALSYMSSSDLRARTVNRQSERREKKAQEEEATKKKEAKELEKSQNENKRNVDNEPEVLISVSVVTRATSPTPPGSAVATTTVSRTRRAEIAKTIEKIIQRSSKKPQYADKEIQSDRLDDSTKYLRYSTSARTSIPWTSPVESKYSRYGSSSSCSKTTRDSLLRSEIDSSERLSKKEDDASKISLRSEKSKSSSDIKNKSLPTKQIQSPPKQKSPDSPSIASPRNLPPTVPKAESPTKSSSSPGINKWPNKDFRKSALNVGPTDRPRKSRTPSTGTDTEDKTATITPPSQIPQRIERSASACSEESDDSSSSASSSSSESDEKVEQTTKSKTSPGKIQSRISNHESSLASDNSSSYNKNGTSANTIRESSGMQDPQQARPKQRHSTSKTSSSPESPATKSDGAKSSLIRTLGCVSNFFASKSQDPNGEEIYLETSSDKSNSIPNDLAQDATGTAAVSQSKKATTATINSKNDNISDDSTLWYKNNQQVDTDSALDLKNDMKYKLRHIDSGEAAWWMKNDDDDTAEDVLKTHVHNDNDENTSKSEQNSWWGKNSEKSSRSKSHDEQNQNEAEGYDWWLGEPENKSAVSPSKASQKTNSTSNSKSPEIHRNASSKSIAQQNSRRSGDRENDVNQNNNSENAYKLKTNPSGDRLWWMGPAKKLFNLRPIESGERAWWLQDDPADKAKDDQDRASESSEDDEDEELNKINENIQEQGTTERVPPLGDRASPEGVEDPSKAQKSPYDNIPSQKPQNEVGQKCFISRHTNIDELLGGSCRPLSPLLDRFSGKNMFMEEITPAQVRIHDSTAQMPFIQRMDRDDWDFTSKNGEPLEEQCQKKVSIFCFCGLLVDLFVGCDL